MSKSFQGRAKDEKLPTFVFKDIQRTNKFMSQGRLEMLNNFQRRAKTEKTVSHDFKDIPRRKKNSLIETLKDV